MNKSITHTVCRWPEASATDIRGVCASLHVAPDVLARVEFHQSEHENVCIVPDSTPNCLIDHDLGDKRPPLGHVQDIGEATCL